ncbi:MAG: hypothetical protein JWN03_4091 [Nocardia sp.]|nr:hypothetical protein [Nocardia sp.]
MSRCHDECQICVTFSGLPPLNYHADPEVAARFARAASRTGVTIAILPAAGIDLPPLPCARLWAC